MTTGQTQANRRLIAIIFLYIPVGIMLALRSFQTPLLSEKLLATAMLLLCTELGRMAWVDLNNVALVRQSQTLSQAENSLLAKFHFSTLSTIVLELLGFYGACAFIPWSLPWGAACVITSQLWFNLLAGAQLLPSDSDSMTEQESVTIEAFGIAKRVPVLVANFIGLVILSFWRLESVRPKLSAGLLSLVILFLIIKYVVPVFMTQSEASQTP